jgi:hypothetical protein
MKVAIIGGGEHLVGKALLNTCKTTGGPVVQPSGITSLEEALQAVDAYKPYLEDVYKPTRLIPKEKEHKCKGGRHQYKLVGKTEVSKNIFKENWACSCGAKL